MSDEADKSIFESFLETNRNTILFFLVGLILVGGGILGFKYFYLFSDSTKIEVLSDNNSSDVSSGLVVEISGEVQKPDVYKMKIDSRINDLLTMAGGLSAEADREWVAKNLNLAEKLVDGAKIFVPKVSNLPNSSNLTNTANLTSRININTAGESELDTLSGVGPVTAKKIINSRPYSKVEDLLEKKVVNKSVFEKIKEQISVY